MHSSGTLDQQTDRRRGDSKGTAQGTHILGDVAVLGQTRMPSTAAVASLHRDAEEVLQVAQKLSLDARTSVGCCRKHVRLAPVKLTQLRNANNLFKAPTCSAQVVSLL